MQPGEHCFWLPTWPVYVAQLNDPVDYLHTSFQKINRFKEMAYLATAHDASVWGRGVISMWNSDSSD